VGDMIRLLGRDIFTGSGRLSVQTKHFEVFEQTACDLIISDNARNLNNLKRALFPDPPSWVAEVKTSKPRLVE
jgi:hypothetical protein